MKKINWISCMGFLLLGSGNVVIAQSNTPFYDNTHFEKRMDPERNMPLNKMKYALVYNEPMQPPSSSYSLSYSTDRLTLGHYPFASLVSTTDIYKGPLSPHVRPGDFEKGLYKLKRNYNFPAKPGTNL